MKMQGKRIMVTGANTGIGEVTARVLLEQGAEVIIACRNQEKAQAAADRMASATGKAAPELLALDLSSFDSIRRAADTFAATGRPLHVLINNAGLAGTRGTTREGFELAFGVNHLGHFLLTHLLKETLVAGASNESPARVVNVASRAHSRTKGIDFQAVQEMTRTRTGFPEYASSKLANVLFSAQLAKRWKADNIHSYAVHPGVVASDVWRRVPGPVRFLMKRFMITNEEGALTTLHCAMSDRCNGETGLYYAESATKEPSTMSQDVALQEKLWGLSLEWAGLRPIRS